MDSDGNVKFEKFCGAWFGGNKFKRGGYNYYQPGRKWERVGIKVIGLYENDDWI